MMKRQTAQVMIELSSSEQEVATIILKQQPKCKSYWRSSSPMTPQPGSILTSAFGELACV